MQTKGEKAWCEYCEQYIHLHQGRFIPHGDPRLGPCPNCGRRPQIESHLLNPPCASVQPLASTG